MPTTLYIYCYRKLSAGYCSIDKNTLFRKWIISLISSCAYPAIKGWNMLREITFSVRDAAEFRLDRYSPSIISLTILLLNHTIRDWLRNRCHAFTSTMYEHFHTYHQPWFRSLSIKEPWAITTEDMIASSIEKLSLDHIVHLHPVLYIIKTRSPKAK